MENLDIVTNILIFSLIASVLIILFWLVKPTIKNLKDWSMVWFFTLLLQAFIYLLLNVGEATFGQEQLFGSLNLSWGFMMFHSINKTKDKPKRTKELLFGTVIWIMFAVPLISIIQVNFKPVEQGIFRTFSLIIIGVILALVFVYEFVIKNISLND